jgi:uncharacterized membrane protein YeaQ/YmgE (transglycosylase-associated protein family)
MLAIVLALALDSEVLVVEYRRGIIGWLLIGLIAGWLAGKIARGRGFGCITDIILGLVGSFLGGWIFTRLGISATNGLLYSLAAATVGAVVLVAIAHLFAGGEKR